MSLSIAGRYPPATTSASTATRTEYLEGTTLVDRDMPAGHHTVVWNGLDARGKPAPSGVYFYRIRAGTYSARNRMVLLR